MSEGGDKQKLSAAEQAIIELMKKNNLEAFPVEGGAAARHAFWDTQVSWNRRGSNRTTDKDIFLTISSAFSVAHASSRS